MEPIQTGSFYPAEEPKPRGRRPKASLRRVTPAVFDFLTGMLLRLRSPARVAALRRNMVDGVSMTEAARQFNVSTNSLENLRKLVANKDDILRPVYGRHTASGGENSQ